MLATKFFLTVDFVMGRVLKRKALILGNRSIRPQYKKRLSASRSSSQATSRGTRVYTIRAGSAMFLTETSTHCKGMKGGNEMETVVPISCAK